jgi:hypothetical protein
MIMAKYEISRADVDQFGSKLDEFGEVLTEKERALLLYAFSLAKKEIEDRVSSGSAPKGDSKSSLPRLSDSFKTAFAKADKAAIETDTEGYITVIMKWE